MIHLAHASNFIQIVYYLIADIQHKFISLIYIQQLTERLIPVDGHTPL